MLGFDQVPTGSDRLRHFYLVLHALIEILEVVKCLGIGAHMRKHTEEKHDFTL